MLFDALETHYHYDARNELKSESSSISGKGETDYTYDSNGSETGSSNSTTGRNVTYTFGVRNKMIGYSDGTTTASYVYDDAGNRVRETAGLKGT